MKENIINLINEAIDSCIWEDSTFDTREYLSMKTPYDKTCYIYNKVRDLVLLYCEENGLDINEELGCSIKDLEEYPLFDEDIQDALHEFDEAKVTEI